MTNHNNNDNRIGVIVSHKMFYKQIFFKFYAIKCVFSSVEYSKRFDCFIFLCLEFGNVHFLSNSYFYFISIHSHFFSFPFSNKEMHCEILGKKRKKNLRSYAHNTFSNNIGAITEGRRLAF